MIAGKWTGTMTSPSRRPGRTCPSCARRAERQGSQYLISGQKIFITYGEHDLPTTSSTWCCAHAGRAEA